MTKRGTTGAGRPQTTGVPRVHRFLKLDGCGTTGDDLRFGQTRVGDKGIRSLTPPVVIHGMAGNGPKLFPRWTRSWLGGEASFLDPSEGETEEPSHVRRWRQQKGPDESQSAVEEERIDEYKPQREMPC